MPGVVDEQSVLRPADRILRRRLGKWQTFVARKKKPLVANVAVARELAGWCWSLAVLDD